MKLETGITLIKRVKGVDHKLLQFLPAGQKLRVAWFDDNSSTYGFISSASIQDVLKLLSLERVVLIAADTSYLSHIGEYVVGGHAFSTIFLLVSNPLGKAAVYTASPPQTLKRNEHAILSLFVSRLLSEGSSFEKLIAKLVCKHGVKNALLMSLTSVKKKLIPVACVGGIKLFIRYEGDWVVVTSFPIRDATRIENGIVTLKYVEGIPRVNVMLCEEFR